MADVFISYARKDAPFVRQLHEALTRNQRDSWVDWEDIPPTAEWMREITAAIEGSNVFVFVITPTSIRSETCKIEIAHAIEHGKRLIPIVREDVAYADVPSPLASLQWLFFRDNDDFDAAFATLLRALDTDLGWVRTHTLLLVRAIEWENKKREPSLLIRGRELTEAETWLARAPKIDPRPTSLQTEFIVTSRTGATSRQRRLIGALAIGIAITLVLAAVALLQRREAVRQRDESERQRRLALARQLAAQAEATRGQDPRLIDRAMLLAVESARRSPDAEALRALRGSLAVLPPFVREFSAGGAIYAVAFSPDDRYVAAGGDQSARVWSAGDGEEVLNVPVTDGIHQIQFLQGGELLAVAGAAPIVRVFNIKTQREVLALTHGALVYALAATIDGRYLATGSDDRTVRVWEIPSGRQVWQARHDGPVRTVAFSRDGSLLASGGYDDTARVWNWSTGRLLATGRHDRGSASMPLRPGSRDGGVHAVAFSADGRYVASGGQDRTARVWEVSSGRELFRARHADAVYAVAFSEELEYLATSGMDGSARLWDLNGGGERFRLVHGGPTEQLQFDRRGRLLTASGDGAARVWDSASGREVARMPHTAYVSAAAFSSDGNRVASASWDGTVRLWESSAGEEAYRLEHGAPLRGVAFRPDGQMLLTWVAGEQDKDAYLWSLDGGGRSVRLRHPDFVDNARFSPDGKLVATACWDGVARLWDAASGSLVRQFQHARRINKVAWSPDGQSLATSGIEEGVARVWNASDGQEIATFAQPGAIEPTMQRMFPAGSVRDVAFSPDGTLLAVAGADGAARLWNIARREQVASLMHGEFVTSVLFSPAGTYLATDAGNEAFIWRVAGGERTAVVKHDDSVTSVAFSGDGRHLLTTSLDRTARVWEAPTGRLVATLLHEHTVFSAEMSEDGAFVLTGSQDNTARIWSTGTWQEMSRLTHGGIVYAARFSRDQRYFATASDDGTSRVGFVRAADLVDQACRRLGRNLTAAEWTQYLGGETFRPTCSLRGTAAALATQP